MSLNLLNSVETFKETSIDYLCKCEWILLRGRVQKFGCNKIVHSLDEVDNTGIIDFLDNNKTIPGAKKLSSLLQ